MWPKVLVALSLYLFELPSALAEAPQTKKDIDAAATRLDAVGRWGHGPVFASAVRGGHLFVGSGGVLRVFRHAPISSEERGPTEIGSATVGGVVRSIVARAGYLYLADASGALVVVDVAKPAKPRIVGSVSLAGQVRDIGLRGLYAYVTTGWRGVTVVDVADPTHPRVVQQRALAGYTTGIHVHEETPIAWVTTRRQGLRILDVSDPLNIRELGSQSVGGYAYDVHGVGRYAYVVGIERDHNSPGGLTVFDARNPMAPVHVGSHKMEYGAEGVWIEGSRAYLAGVANDAGLVVVDISEHENLRETGRYRHPTCSESVLVDGSHAYLAHGDVGLEVIDISSGRVPAVTHPIPAAGRSRGIHVQDGMMVIANGYGGVRVLDVSNPASMRGVGSVGTYRALDVRVHGDYAIVADGWAGVRVVQISDPTDPVVVDRLRTAGDALAVDVLGNRAYIAGGTGGLRILDIKNPKQIREIGAHDTDGSAYGMHVSRRGLVYVADGEQGLKIVDTSDASSPVELGSLRPDCPRLDVRDIAVVGQFSLLAAGYCGVVVVDISKPREPREVGRYPTAHQAWSVHVDGEHAYVGSRRLLRVLDVSRPLSLREVFSLEVPGKIEDISSSEGMIYVAASAAGVLALTPRRGGETAPIPVHTR